MIKYTVCLHDLDRNEIPITLEHSRSRTGWLLETFEEPIELLEKIFGVAHVIFVEYGTTIQAYSKEMFDLASELNVGAIRFVPLLRAINPVWRLMLMVKTSNIKDVGGQLKFLGDLLHIIAPISYVIGKRFSHPNIPALGLYHTYTWMAYFFDSIDILTEKWTQKNTDIRKAALVFKIAGMIHHFFIAYAIRFNQPVKRIAHIALAIQLLALLQYSWNSKIGEGNLRNWTPYSPKN